MSAFIDAAAGYALSAWQSAIWVFFAPDSFLSPWPIAVAILIAAVALAARQRKSGAGVTFGQIVRELFPTHIYKHASARHDFWIILINQGLFYFLPIGAALTIGVAQYSIVDGLGLQGAMEAPPHGGFMHLALFSIYAMLVWDFFATYAHYLKHKIPVLWELHKVHHCAEVLTPLTALRRHPLEIVVTALIGGGAAALSVIFWVLIFGAPGTALELVGISAGVYLWRLLGYNIRHSHIWISYGPFWNNILMSPAHHQLHHSRDPRHYDCNFGHIFPFWDRLFGTLYQPIDGEKFEFGIEREENEKLRTLSALYFRPLKKAAARFAHGDAAKPLTTPTPAAE